MKIFSFLLNFRGEPDIYTKLGSYGQSILHKAAINNDKTLIEKLLTKDGIRLDQPDYDKKTPLIYACDQSESDSSLIIVKLLLSCRASLDC